MTDLKPGTFDSAQKEEALATLNFPFLFTPRAYTHNGKAVGKVRYDASFELDANNPDIEAMKVKALAAARTEFPNLDIVKEYREGRFQMPWSAGDKLADKAQEAGKKREYSRGRIVLIARSDFPPALSVIENGRKVDYFGPARPNAEAAFYPGVKVWFGVTFTGYAVDGKRGVAAYLDWIISSKTGTRLAGGSRSEAEVYGGYAGVLSSEDPTRSAVEDDALSL
jgi:Protein of unknown function (DUF2815)